MTTPMNHFVTESNIDIYLSRLRETADGSERSKLMRLLTAELSSMGQTCAHLEKAERRVADLADRMRWQRQELVRLKDAQLPTGSAASVLQTMERAHSVLLGHCQQLRKAVKDSRT
jgi:hypothetical protein